MSFRTSDIAEALNASPSTIAKIASREGIRGEREGLGRGKQTRYTLEQAEAIAKAHRGGEGVSRLHDWMKRTMMQEERKLEGKGQAERTRGDIVQRALSESYARTVMRMMDETDWWIDAITRIGHSAVLIAFQEAKVPPEELYDEIRKFKNADEFVAKVEEYFSALYEAKNDAQVLIEKRKKERELKIKLRYTVEIGKELVKRLKAMENMYNLAVLNLDEEGVRKLATAMPLLILQSTEE